MARSLHLLSLGCMLLFGSHVAAQAELVLNAPEDTWACAAAANGDILIGSGNTVARLGPDGAMLWAVTYEQFRLIRGVLEIDGGDLIVAGSMAEGPDLFVGVMRTTATGSVVWARILLSDPIPAELQGGNFSVVLRRCDTHGFILYDTFDNERRLSRFTGNGAVVWSRLYTGGNFIKDIAVDSITSKLFVTDGSDIYRFDLMDGHTVWQRGLGVVGTAVSIACNGARLGIGYTGPGADGAIAVMDTTGELLGAIEWDDTALTQGNNRIVAHGDGFTLASGTLAGSDYTVLLFTVDTGLTTQQVLSLPASTPMHYDATATASGGLLLSGGLIAQVDPASPGPCITVLPLVPHDPGLSGASTSGTMHVADALVPSLRAVTTVVGTIGFTPACLTTGTVGTAFVATQMIARSLPNGDLVVDHAIPARSLRVFDARGALVIMQRAMATGTTVIEGRALLPGMYTIVADDAYGGVLGTARCVVVR